jgi:hypothetical protein
VMIWTTAKSTDVNKRHNRRPARARRSAGAARDPDARTAAGEAMAKTLRAGLGGGHPARSGQ